MRRKRRLALSATAAHERGRAACDGPAETDRAGGNARRGGRAAPQRSCIVTRASAPSAALIRFALAPDLTVTPDLAEKLPGRGAWVIADADAVSKAASSGAFARAFKARATAPADLAEQVRDGLRARCLEGLGLAKRAGALVLGFDKTRQALRGDRPLALLIEAADGASDGRDKLLKLAAGRRAEPTPILGCFTAAELGLALGRENVIHGALAAGGLARRLLRDGARLAGFQDVSPTEWGADPFPSMAYSA